MVNQAYNHITNAKMEEMYIEYFGQSIGDGIENRRKIHIMEVKFYEIEEIDDSLLKYAVIVSRYMDKWIFCKNKTRKWELPGGHREDGESIIDTAKRELFEETGAKEFEIVPICAYSITNYGILFFADIKELGNLPESEIERINLFQDIPEELSFPLFHPRHFNKVKEVLKI